MSVETIDLTPAPNPGSVSGIDQTPAATPASVGKVDLTPSASAGSPATIDASATTPYDDGDIWLHVSYPAGSYVRSEMGGIQPAIKLTADEGQAGPRLVGSAAALSAPNNGYLMLSSAIDLTGLTGTLPTDIGLIIKVTGDTTPWPAAMQAELARLIADDHISKTMTAPAGTVYTPALSSRLDDLGWTYT